MVHTLVAVWKPADMNHLLTFVFTSPYTHKLYRKLPYTNQCVNQSAQQNTADKSAGKIHHMFPKIFTNEVERMTNSPIMDKYMRIRSRLTNTGISL